MAKQTREQLGVKEGDKIVLKGVVSFARLDKAVTGEALARENERRAKYGMLPTKEFRSITIENPEIIEGKGTPLAKYYGQNIYKGKQSGVDTMSFESKSLYPPQFGHIVDGKIQTIPDPQKNPAKGQVVYILIEAYKAKGYSKLGSTFNSILYAEGEINFYEGQNSLSGFGKALGMEVSEAAEVTQENDTRQPVNAPAEQPAQTASGFGDAPVEQPNQQPAASNPFGITDEQIQGDSESVAPVTTPVASPFA